MTHYHPVQLNEDFQSPVTSSERTILITGASGDIGQAVAMACLKRGDRVILQGNQHIHRLNYLLDHPNVTVIKSELSTQMGIESFVKQIQDLNQTIYGYVHAAGFAHLDIIQNMDFKTWMALVHTHLSSAYFITKTLLSHLIPAQKGRIVLIGSMWGEVGASCEVAYSACKAGLIGLTKAMSKELGPSGITVNCVSPGLIHTAMNQMISEEVLLQLTDDIPLGRMGTPEEVAQSCAFLLSDAAGFITGQVLGINGGQVV